MMNIAQATRSYESWLCRLITTDRHGVALKHAKMTEDPMGFLRSTFYRWTQVWPDVCPELALAPVTLSVGDLHIENFGKWRDTEGRLVWGVSDYDEAHPLPYPNDLVRLATSVFMALHANRLSISRHDACAAILEGYKKGMKKGIKPFVLEEKHHKLREIALGQRPDPRDFWAKMDQLKRASDVPDEAVAALVASLPQADLEYAVYRRQAGAGSLGRPRYVALAEWRGGRIAREAKTMVPSACHWAGGAAATSGLVCLTPRIIQLLPFCDPYLRINGPFMTRRLAPNCNKIELKRIEDEQAQYTLLKATGRETANIHLLCGGGSATEIASHLGGLGKNWLHHAARDMEEKTMEDWQKWKESRS